MLATQAKANCKMKLIFVMCSQTGPLCPIFPFPGSLFHCELTMTVLHEGPLPPQRGIQEPKQKKMQFSKQPRLISTFPLYFCFAFQPHCGAITKDKGRPKASSRNSPWESLEGAFQNLTWPLLSQTAFRNQSCRCNREKKQVL